MSLDVRRGGAIGADRPVDQAHTMWRMEVYKSGFWGDDTRASMLKGRRPIVMMDLCFWHPVVRVYVSKDGVMASRASISSGREPVAITDLWFRHM